jgi:phage protein U
MADLVIARLGNVEFSVQAGSFESLQRRTSWRIDRPDPIDGMGTPVFRGRMGDSITLSGVVFPGYVGRLNSVERLRQLGDKGEPLMLADGEGAVYGEWLIEYLEEEATLTTPLGKPRRISYSLTLAALPARGASKP